MVQNSPTKFNQYLGGIRECFYKEVGKEKKSWLSPKRV